MTYQALANFSRTTLATTIMLPTIIIHRFVRKNSLTQLVSAGLLLILAAINVAQADVTAELPDDSVEFGDLIYLIVTATGEDAQGKADFSALQNDFHLGTTSQRFNQQNTLDGTIRSNRTYIIPLEAKRSGTLTIPSLTVGQNSSQPLTLTVAPQTPKVQIRAELSSNETWRDAPVVYTIKVYSRVGLNNFSPQIPRSQMLSSSRVAFYTQPEVAPYQVTENGLNWMVYEKNYLVVPKLAGDIRIPGPKLRSNQGSYLPFTGPELTLKVNTTPANYPIKAQWLPLQNLAIESSWSSELDTLREGEPITRTITLKAQAQVPMELEPIEIADSVGFKSYPGDQVSGAEPSSNAFISRSEYSFLYIPERSGELELAEITIPWFNTTTGKMAFAKLPAQKVTVAPSITAPPSEPAIAPPAAGSGDGTSRWWKIASVAFAVLWLLTLSAFLIFMLKGKRTQPAARKISKPTLNIRSRKEATSQLQQACKQFGQADADTITVHNLRHAVIHYARAHMPSRSARQTQTLDDVIAAAGDDYTVWSQINQLHSFAYGKLDFSATASDERQAFANDLLATLQQTQFEQASSSGLSSANYSQTPLPALNPV